MTSNLKDRIFSFPYRERPEEGLFYLDGPSEVMRDFFVDGGLIALANLGKGLDRGNEGHYGKTIPIVAKMGPLAYPLLARLEKIYQRSKRAEVRKMVVEAVVEIDEKGLWAKEFMWSALGDSEMTVQLAAVGGMKKRAEMWPLNHL